MICEPDEFSRFVGCGEVSVGVEAGVIARRVMWTAWFHGCWCRFGGIGLWRGKRFGGELELLTRVGCELEGQ